MVNEVNPAGVFDSQTRSESDVFVNQTVFKASASSAKQTQFLVWIESAVPDPAVEKIIAAAEEYASRPFDGRASEKPLEESLSCRAQLLIRIQTQNPLAGRFGDRRVLLGRETFPWLLEHSRSE
jgi:hypothetical protein